MKAANVMTNAEACKVWSPGDADAVTEVAGSHGSIIVNCTVVVAPLMAEPAVGVSEVIVREWTPACDGLLTAELTVQVRALLSTVTAAEIADGIVLV